MRFALAPLLFALACSSSSSGDEKKPSGSSPEPADPPPADAAPPPVEVSIDAAAPRGPHITLSLLGRYRDPNFGAVGLPAVSADRKRVAFVRELEDGGRGNPNLSLIIRDAAADKNLEVIEVLPVEPRWRPEREAEVRGKLAGANRRLAAGSWTPMDHPDYDDAAIDGAAMTLAIGALTVRARGDRLEIARGRRVLARRQLRSWLGPGAQGCPVAPRLRDARAGSGLVLVEIGFEGAPGCWREPEQRIIRL